MKRFMIIGSCGVLMLFVFFAGYTYKAVPEQIEAVEAKTLDSELVMLREIDYDVSQLVRDAERYLITGDEDLYENVLVTADSIKEVYVSIVVSEDKDEEIDQLISSLGDVKKLYENLEHNQMVIDRLSVELIQSGHEYVGRQIYVMSDYERQVDEALSEDTEAVVEHLNNIGLCRQRISNGDRILNQLNEVQFASQQAQITKSYSDIKMTVVYLEDLETLLNQLHEESTNEIDAKSLETMRESCERYRSALESLVASWNILNSKCLNTRELFEEIEANIQVFRIQ